jgi:NAD(P)-dependent dehydrogenase (short-subunit alcohol dehydrogenase family)
LWPTGIRSGRDSFWPLSQDEGVLEMQKQPDSPSLAGKVALVTGGSRGLGREMVLAFARAGAHVIVASRNQESCVDLAREVAESTGRRALAQACHMGRWSDIQTLVDASYEEFGRIDVLVNNAGMAPLYPSLQEVSEDLFDKVVAVNLKGPFRLSALVGLRMVDGGGGSIINISSVAAVKPAPDDLPYAAAKAGLDTLTAGFALAYGPKVRVNSIMAGPFFTDISKSWDRAKFDEIVKAYPLRRGGEPTEIIGAALFLASDMSSFTTGSVLRVDGGMAVAH